MKRKRLQPFLLIPLLLIFVFSWTQASETVLCVSDSQTHYARKNPLRMMACHAPSEDRAHNNHNPHTDTQALNPGTSSCMEILLASANSIRPPEDEQLKTAASPRIHGRQRTLRHTCLRFCAVRNTHISRKITATPLFAPCEQSSSLFDTRLPAFCVIKRPRLIAFVRTAPEPFAS
jgi:hypothetical protein